MSRGSRRRASTIRIYRCVVALLLAAASLDLHAGIDDGSTPALPPQPSSFVGYSAVQWLYDNNVFRLPRAGADLGTLVGPGASFEDHIKAVEAGMNMHWAVARQSLDVAAEGSHSWFARNTDLNNTQGTVSAIFNGQVGDRLSGQVGELYSRSLSNFAYTGIYVKDLISNSEPFVTARIRVLPRWVVFGGLRVGETTHSSQELEVDDFRRRSGNFGLQYELQNDNYVGWEYRYTEGRFRFAQLAIIDGIPFDRDYKEYTENLIVRYALSGRLLLKASGGYLNRSYPNSVIGAFSGSAWRASLQWQPTSKTQLLLTGWRELRAYVEAESNYFVAKGVSLTPTWNPTERISVAIVASYEDQRFVASDLSVAASSLRHDLVRSQQVTITYTPRDFVSIVLSYQHNNRGSTLNRFEYGDETAMLNISARL